MKCLYFENKMLLNSTTKILCLLVLMYPSKIATSQVFTDSPCYTVSGGTSNKLFTYTPSTKEWAAAPSPTGATSINAIAVDDTTNTIYAVDGGTFGTIDSRTGIFKAIGSIGTGNGDYDSLLLDNIDGLTYDSSNRIMYASHRIYGEEPGTEDVLFQIKIETGKIQRGVMMDATGKPADYAIIPAVFDSTVEGSIYNVTDIAYHPILKKLYAVHNQKGPSILTIINSINAQLEDVVFDINDDLVEGLGFTPLGELYGTTGNYGNCNSSDSTDMSCKNMLIHIDFLGQYASSNFLSRIDPTGVAIDYKCFACLSTGPVVILEDRITDFIDIYPNPSTGVFKIDVMDYNLSKVMVSLYNSGGQQIQQPIALQQNRQWINYQHLANGIYYLKVRLENKVLQQKLIVVK